MEVELCERRSENSSASYLRETVPRRHCRVELPGPGVAAARRQTHGY
jgi:hypothetical protein